MKSRWSRLWPPAAAVLLLLLLWQAAVVLLDIERWMLPSPLDVLRELAANPPVEHTLATARLTAIGFPIGTLVGIGTAVLLHLLPWTRRAFYPLLVLSQNIPTIALAPLLVIWFGFGLLPKIILITLVCFFPVAVAMMGGLGGSDRAMRNYMQMAGAGRWTIFRKLELPSSLPPLFSGIRISAAYAVTGAVVAEWLGSDRGLGNYMQLQKAAYRTDRMFVAIFIIVALSLLLFALVALLERWLVRWKRN
ncbi:ABC transporter permease [Paenibacillus spiritus]|uniref:ABC transporter permease n=1 Tax=Paenibacillus spiritus TaxID=2496557 RepID=A0A5J5G2B8_9BACL|nr:ABC transporter permease [Paenibacillus spiritus]KAA9000979.1 ABC transporter permease [Paenibacillus spiritus]